MRVGLNEVVVGTRLEVAVAGRDDARGDRAAQAEGVADGDHPVADAGFVGIAPFGRWQRLAAPHLEDRQVGLVIASDHLGLQGGAIVQQHKDLIDIFDDVMEGHDMATRINDETGA